MRLRLITAAGVLATAALTAMIMFAADPGLLSLAMPDARAMAGINVEQVRLSPFGQYLMAQIAEREAGLQTLIDATGFDPAPRSARNPVSFARWGRRQIGIGRGSRHF